uniref:Solute carrier family 22 member 18 n=1 Tax=Sus scrofa TaxID=9823 RepID=A0A8D0MD26_PIG
MREAGAPRGQGQSPRGTRALSQPQIILLTYVLSALELTCLFMHFSVLPYLSRRLGLDSVAFGYQQTLFGVLQLLGGPVFGRFADQRGARAAFTLSFLASSGLYLLLAAACSPALPGVTLLFASRLPGALMHTLPAAQMVLADLSAPEERPTALSRLGLCFGVGVIFGSLLGGTLSSSCGIQCPVIVALVVSLLGAVLSFTCIPTNTKGASDHAQPVPPGRTKASVFDLKAISRLLLQPGVLPVFLVKVISGFPSGLFTVMFSIISMDFFQLEAAQASYLMSFFGVLQMETPPDARGQTWVGLPWTGLGSSSWHDGDRCGGMQERATAGKAWGPQHGLGRRRSLGRAGIHRAGWGAGPRAPSSVREEGGSRGPELCLDPPGEGQVGGWVLCHGESPEPASSGGPHPRQGGRSAG